MIYLDYAATTPVDQRVAEKLNRFLTIDTTFANPASRSHMLGWQAEAAVEHARKQVASLLRADTREIVWTSGATEANNLAIKGVAEVMVDKGRHIITSCTEHKAVVDSIKYLEGHGYDVTWLSPNEHGQITASSVEAAIRPDTILVSIMHVNNETGIINNVQEIGEITRSRDVLFHIDAAQSAGKLPLDVGELPADLISVSAHKVYGPKGIGALYVRRKAGFQLLPQIHGGGHERGMRSGTLPTHQIAAMGEAFEIANSEREMESEKVMALKEAFKESLGDIAGMAFNGDQSLTVPGIVNISFSGLDGQVLLSALPKLAISSGSACNSASMAPSHVLKAMGVSDDMALSALRISFGRFTTIEDVKEAGANIRDVVMRMMQSS